MAYGERRPVARRTTNSAAHVPMARAVSRFQGSLARPASMIRPHECPAVSGAGNLSEAFSLQPLALQLSRSPNGLRGFAGATLGRLFVMPTKLHLSENAFPLHLLLERLKRLINVVVTHEDLHLAACSFPGAPPMIGGEHIRPAARVPARGVAL